MGVNTRTRRRKRKKHGFRGLIVFAAFLFAAFYLVSYIGKYPEDMKKLFVSNPEARGFVINYPSHIEDSDIGEISDSELSGGIPHFLQWDERWGYFTYGSSVLGITGCGPTALSMVIVGLTGNKDATPAAIANFSEQNGYYVPGTGTSWDLMTTGAAAFGLRSVQVSLSEETMTAELAAGNPLVVSVGPGDFTSAGHFFVITGYEDGKFSINDPNSKKLSKEDWSYATLEPQIMSIWAFSAA